MTRLLFENAWPLIAMAAITTALLVAGAIKTAKAGLLYAAAVMLAVMALLFCVERWIVTPGEEVRSTLHAIARDLERNDVDSVLSYISPAATTMHDEVSSILPRVEIHRATIKPNLNVEIIGDPPNAAKAKFNGVVVASERKGHLKNQHGAFIFEVDFRLENGQWRLWSYQRKDPREGMR